ncbi:MAG: hypothetical protein Fur0044_33030 [Anaerolineae bacterium]
MPAHSKYGQDKAGDKRRTTHLQTGQGIARPTRFFPLSPDDEKKRNQQQEIVPGFEWATGSPEQNIEPGRAQANEDGQAQGQDVPFEANPPASDLAQPTFQTRLALS